MRFESDTCTQLTVTNLSPPFPEAVRDSCAGPGRFRSPDKQQDESVQTPFQGPEPDALDPDQLVGLVLTQAASTAGHDRDPLLWKPFQTSP